MLSSFKVRLPWAGLAESYSWTETFPTERFCLCVEEVSSHIGEAHLRSACVRQISGRPPRDPVFSSAILLGVSRIVGCHFGVYLSDLQFHLAGRLSQGRRLAQQAGGRVGRPTWRAPEGGLEDMGVAPALTAGRGRGFPFHSHEERNSASHRNASGGRLFFFGISRCGHSWPGSSASVGPTQVSEPQKP